MAEFDLKSFLARIESRLSGLEKRPALSTLQAVYPVGSVYISFVSTSPEDLFGFGTWAACATGRAIVGINASDADFHEAGHTGGSKTHTLASGELPAHRHADYQYGYSGTPEMSGLALGSGFTDTGINRNLWGSSTIENGSGGAHNNLQPYEVFYVWKRTA